MQWQWQLAKTFSYPSDLSAAGPDRLDMVDIELFYNSPETIAQIKSSGTRVMCYFEAGTWNPGKTGNPFNSLYPDSVKGLPYEPPYQTERWLDVASPIVRDLMKKTLDVAKQKGCDAVEPDNVQGFETDIYNTGLYKCPAGTNYYTGCMLDYNEWRDFNLFLANEAHARGLAIALKNNYYMAAEMSQVHDMVLSEECKQYNECGSYDVFIKAGKPVLLVEYDSAGAASLCQCAASKKYSAMTKTTALTNTDRKACCGSALATSSTCSALCLAASQDPATCTPTSTGRKLMGHV